MSYKPELKVKVGKSILDLVIYLAFGSTLSLDNFTPRPVTQHTPVNLQQHASRAIILSNVQHCISHSGLLGVGGGGCSNNFGVTCLL